MAHIKISTDPRCWDSSATAESVRAHLVMLMAAAERAGVDVLINGTTPPAGLAEGIEWSDTWRSHRLDWDVDDWARWFAAQAGPSPRADSGSQAGFQWRDTAGNDWLRPVGHHS